MGIRMQTIHNLKIIAKGNGWMVWFPEEKPVIIAAAVADPVSFPVKNQTGYNDQGGFIGGQGTVIHGLRSAKGAVLYPGKIGNQNKIHVFAAAFGQGDLFSVR